MLCILFGDVLCFYTLKFSLTPLSRLLRLKDAEANFNSSVLGGGGPNASRMTSDVFEDGFVHSDSGRSSEQAVS